MNNFKEMTTKRDINDFFSALEGAGIKRNTKEADSFYLEWLKEGTKLPLQKQKEKEQELEQDPFKAAFDKHFELIDLLDDEMQSKVIASLKAKYSKSNN
jgi:hypothetical protein